VTESTKEIIWGTGRRKCAVARVRIKPGTGTFLVNELPLPQYFPTHQEQLDAMAPLRATETAERYDIQVQVNGGGKSAQAGAVKLGLARALMQENPGLEATLRGNGLLTRDSRMVERKKYGRHKARRSFQFSKR
jgi:small subunit ribosomal protein S9